MPQAIQTDAHEHVLYDGARDNLSDNLRANRNPRNLRLKQERIGFARVRKVLGMPEAAAGARAFLAP